MNNLETTWLERPRDREMSVGLVFLGALVTVIAFFFAFIFGMGYRNSWLQDSALLLMYFGPTIVYLLTLIVSIRLIRARRRSWPVALASCLGPVGVWFFGLGIMGISYAFRLGLNVG